MRAKLPLLAGFPGSWEKWEKWEEAERDTGRGLQRPPRAPVPSWPVVGLGRMSRNVGAAVSVRSHSIPTQGAEQGGGGTVRRLLPRAWEVGRWQLPSGPSTRPP